MRLSKKELGQAGALSALGIGSAEQAERMPEKPAPKEQSVPQSKPKAIPTSVQFTPEGLNLLRLAQARLLERGVPRAAAKGVVLEVVLMEWLRNQPERID
jgi:hypothetical protein